MSRTFLAVLVPLLLTVALWVAAIPDRTASPELRTGRIRASQTLVRAFVAELCRPPTDKETVEWESRPIGGSALGEAIHATGEGAKVQMLRVVVRDALRRPAGIDDCPRIRGWIDGGLDATAANRELMDSPEGRRVAAVRRAFVDEFGRDPRDWDDASLRWWVERPLTLTQIRTGLAAQRPLVGIHFFTWYRPEGDDVWRNDVTIVPSESPRPSAGLYASSDVTVMRRQIGQLAGLGLDFVIVHVVAQSPASWANARTFFRLHSGPDMKAAILLDGLYADSAESKARWVTRARDEFATAPTYFSFHGQPLVMLFSAPLNFGVPGVELRNVYWNDRYDPGRNTFNADLGLYPRDWPFWAPTPQPVVNGVVPVMPGYVDTQLGRDRTMEHPRAAGQFYREQWHRALALRPEVILIYSWNEYFERTGIEPTNLWGEQYLRWTACYVALAHRGATGDCP